MTPMTAKDVWWGTYFAALTGICADPNSTEVTRQAEMLADEAVERFVCSDGSVYNPRPSDYGVGK